MLRRTLTGRQGLKRFRRLGQAERFQPTRQLRRPLVCGYDPPLHEYDQALRGILKRLRRRYLGSFRLVELQTIIVRCVRRGRRMPGSDRLRKPADLPLHPG